MCFSKLEEISQNGRKMISNHSLFNFIETPQDLRHFMQYYSFEVWWYQRLEQMQEFQTGNKNGDFDDFMKLLISSNIQTNMFSDFLEAEKQNSTTKDQLKNLDLPTAVSEFIKFHLQIAAKEQAHEHLAVLIFGQKHFIVEKIQSLIEEVQLKSPNQKLDDLKAYFKQQSFNMNQFHQEKKHFKEICGQDKIKWEEAQASVEEFNSLREKLWNTIQKRILIQKGIA